MYKICAGNEAEYTLFGDETDEWKKVMLVGVNLLIFATRGQLFHV